MYQKLFQITLVLLLIVISIAMLGLLVSVILSMFSSQMIAESSGISAGAGGITSRQLGYMVIGASLVIAGFYLFFRRRRFRR
jgi:LPXTG-motif cell wall-anchored protein